MSFMLCCPCACAYGLVCRGPRAAWHWYLASMAWLYTESWCHCVGLACVGPRWHPGRCWCEYSIHSSPQRTLRNSSVNLFAWYCRPLSLNTFLFLIKTIQQSFLQPDLTVYYIDAATAATFTSTTFVWVIYSMDVESFAFYLKFM